MRCSGASPSVSGSSFTMGTPSGVGAAAASTISSTVSGAACACEARVASWFIRVLGDLGPEEDALARVRIDDGAHLAGNGIFHVHEHLDLREAE
jgi:hypothetical protein